MLPIPSERFIPEWYERDEKLIAFADKLDSIIEELSKETLAITDLIDPLKIQSEYLYELGYLVNANIMNSDTDRVKREKIAKAIQSHKLRGTWKYDIKPKIDSVAGGDAQLYSTIGSDEFVLIGDNTVSQYWSIFGTDGVATDYGIRLLGSGVDDLAKGVILVNVDNSSLTTDEVEQIKMDIADSIPAYYIIKLGYISSGLFVMYANGQIG